jgi:hypothetical protein
MTYGASHDEVISVESHGAMFDYCLMICSSLLKQMLVTLKEAQQPIKENPLQFAMLERQNL